MPEDLSQLLSLPLEEKKKLLERAQLEFAFRGSLRHLTRRYGQRRLYDEIADFKADRPNDLNPFVANCHRRFGKSFLAVLLGIQRCISRPGERVRFGASTHQQAEDITSDALETVLNSIPPELRPHKRERKYTFRNPRWTKRGKSELSLHNLDSQKGAHLRGLGATMWVLDECRDLRDLPALMKEVILFHMVDAMKQEREPLLLLLSTPPHSPAHPFTSEFVPMAVQGNTYFRITTEENEDWSKEDEEELVRFCGGRESLAWRREALCDLHVGDSSVLVVPEMQETDCVISAYERPSHFFPFLGADLGWSDRSGGVVAYIDFERQMLVVEDCFFEQYRSMGELAQIMETLGGSYYGGSSHRMRAVADATPLELETLKRDFHYPIMAAEKHDRDAGIASVRTAIRAGRIVIHERAVPLIEQMKYGVWNPKRTDFERTDSLGHLDCFTALVYLWRMASRLLCRNPFPHDVPVGENVIHIGSLSSPNRDRWKHFGRYQDSHPSALRRGEKKVKWNRQRKVFRSRRGGAL